MKIEEGPTRQATARSSCPREAWNVVRLTAKLTFGLAGSDLPMLSIF